MDRKSFIEFLGPLSVRNFQFFILGHFISFIGSWIQNTALYWLIYKIRNSTFDLGLFTFFSLFPTTFITLFSGIIIDYFDRKRLLQILLILEIIPPAILGSLVAMNYSNFIVFIILAFLSSLLASIDMPIRQVFISEIIPSFYLTKALSLQALSFNLARMIGPVLAGYIMVHFAHETSFFLNALSFLPFLIFLKFINPSFQKKIEKEKKIEIFIEIKNFYIFLKNNKEIFLILIILAVFTFFATSVIIILPMLVVMVLQGTGKDFAFLSSGIGLGAIFGALYVFLFKDPKRKIYFLWFSHLLWCLGCIFFIIGKSFLFLYLGSLLIGFSFTNFFPVINALLQEKTPHNFKGKIMSLYSIIFIGFAPLGQSLMGLLAELISYKFLVIFIIMALLSINFLIFIKLSSYRREGC